MGGQSVQVFISLLFAFKERLLENSVFGVCVAHHLDQRLCPWRMYSHALYLLSPKCDGGGLPFNILQWDIHRADYGRSPNESDSTESTAVPVWRGLRIKLDEAQIEQLIVSPLLN